MVIDADGINNLNMEELKILKNRCILTPHPGEFSRLTGFSIKEIEENRLDIAVEFAYKNKIVLVLKGVPTVIATPDGYSYINSTGNSGLASGGSGDVLTGLIGGFLAQGIKLENAAVCGVFVHGLSADIAVEDKETEYSITASLVLDYINKAIRKIIEDAC